jgi:SagB-type dehydrogenase family enzyme
MKKVGVLILTFLFFALIFYFVFKEKIPQNFNMKLKKENLKENTILLEEPKTKGSISLEEAILKRRSHRSYKKEALGFFEISQILWAAQGITSPEGLRSVPSAGALYPLEIFLVVGKVEKLDTGVYKYNPENHSLSKIKDGDLRSELSIAALGQSWVKEAPAVLVIGAVFERTTKKYGERGIRYVYMEAGHSSQNVYLQATALNLGTVTVGAFDDEKVKEILGLPENVLPLYLMPIGKLE